ncbi:MAG: malate synthase G [Gammaproteobacteria bacterium]|nr:malate synthase G [Gammaproteobacteria bacterium]
MINDFETGGLRVAAELAAFVNDELLPEIGLGRDAFWSGFESLIDTFTTRNEELLARRDELQKQIDGWHHRNPGPDYDRAAYRAFLREIGYLEPEPGDFQISTVGVDAEIATIAGPQLVVPVKNARFATNAANARWGSLYDALYGSDVIPEDGGAGRGGGYNPVRGQRVIDYARRFLDEICPLAGATQIPPAGAGQAPPAGSSHAPLANASHANVLRYRVADGALMAECAGGACHGLRDPAQFAGFTGPGDNPSAVLLRNHGLHIEIGIDRGSEVGAADPAGVGDIVLEAALTTIADCEDSVAAVDAADKTAVYRNWLGLMRGDLAETFSKNGEPITRTLAADRQYRSPQGETFKLPGRSLLLVRNVGHLMRNNAIHDSRGRQVFEGILDAVVTAAIGCVDVQGRNRLGNSRTGGIYIVKPKMHGPDEVRFTRELFAAVEYLLGLAPLTLKLGIMDEERRTTVNLKRCIYEARDRVVFINTGFLDRTGDEIHTGMHAGPMLPREEMKNSTWIGAYENHNVDTGLACGLPGRAQIGKGMWPMPDRMAAMIEEKAAHPLAGASTAWVPSPTAAVLHAMHYHRVDVFAVQRALRERRPAALADLLEVPLLPAPAALGAGRIQRELDNNIQGILGYVARWIDQGIGCSKVPNIDDVALMEDRATLRISSQYVANYLHHGLCGEEQVEESLLRMAAVVDAQNAADPLYEPMAPNPAGSFAFQAARDLIFQGVREPNGYTEPALHRVRLAKKQAARE